MTVPTRDLTLMEVAQELGRSLEQVRRYAREGKLPAHKLGMQWFVKRRDLKAFKLGGKRSNQAEVLARARALSQDIEERVGRIDVVELLDQYRRSRP